MGTYHPGVVKSSNTIFVQFNAATDAVPLSAAYLIRSTDCANSWLQPVELIAKHPAYPGNGEVHTSEAIMRTSSGTLIVPFGKQEQKNMTVGFPATYPPGTTNVADIDAMVIRSTDNGETWSDVDHWIGANGNSPPGTRECACPFGKIIQLANGTLILPHWAYWSWSTTSTHTYLASCGYVKSTDDGQAWGSFNFMGDYGETALLLLNNGNILSVSKNPNATNLVIMKSTNSATTWSIINSSMTGKNASLHLSPHGIPLLFGSPNGTEVGKPSIGYYSLDEGISWTRGFHITPPNDPTLFSYALSATNLGSETFIVVYQGQDLSKTELGASGWSSTKTYLGYTIFREIPLSY